MVTENKSLTDSGSAATTAPTDPKQSPAKRKRIVKSKRAVIVHRKKGMNENRDYTKYIFNNKRLGKGNNKRLGKGKLV